MSANLEICATCRHCVMKSTPERFTGYGKGRVIMHPSYNSPVCTAMPEWKEVSDVHYCGRWQDRNQPREVK